ncbi:MAG TPA: hypothetical protein VF599_14860 [Pyrinomonadaceae bacterium]
MADRTNPFLEIGFSEYTGIHLMPFALKERAAKHEYNRERVVISIMLDLHLMALTGFIGKTTTIGLRGAITQNLEGHEGDAAAHCAPRQLIINGRPPQAILARPPRNSSAKPMPERAFALDVLFGEADILPVNFNICDSRAERRGLNGAFLNGCRQAIKAGLHGGEMKADAISSAVKAAFDKYKSDSKTAFQSSVTRLKDKLKPKYLFPYLRARWTEQLQITEQYADALAGSDVAQQKTDLALIEGLIRVYTIQ